MNFRYFNLLIIIIIIKKEYIQQQKISSIVFNAVNDEKLFDLVKIENRKQNKIYEDKSLKEGDKVCCSQRIKEDEGRKTYMMFFSKEKTKAPNMKDIILFTKH